MTSKVLSKFGEINIFWNMDEFSDGGQPQTVSEEGLLPRKTKAVFVKTGTVHSIL